MERLAQIKFASWVGILGNILLALSKIIFGLLTGSLAVIGDGIDSTTDILSFLIILFAARIIAKAPDQEHPYGHHRAEPLATVIIAFIIFFVGAQLFQSSLSRIFSPRQPKIASTIAIYVTVFSVIGKILLALYQYRAGQKTHSSMLIANSKNMFNDIFISLGVLLGLGFTVWLKLPVVDALIALAVSIWIMKTAVLIFIETNTELMEGIGDTSIYNQIFENAALINGVVNPHRVRIRKLANLLVIDIDIEVDGGMSVAQGHAVAVELEQKLRTSIDNVYDISVHVEPKGNVEHQEKYGVSKKELS